MSRVTLRASRRRKYRIGAAVLTAGLPLVALAEMAPAESASSFAGVASADGLRITTSAPGFLVVEDFIDGGGPTAQAAVSDLEGNRGFASVPYPGELALAGPGLFAIATGQQFPGHYPFHVASAHPTTPKNGYEVPGLSMQTESDASSSSAASRFGPSDEGDGSGARSTAKVVKSADGVTSEATAWAHAVKVGPVEILGFVSSAKVRRAPGGEPERSSSMQFSLMKVADTMVGVRDGHFVVAGTTVPLDGFGPVQKALADAGVAVELVGATPTDDGVVAPGIQITRKQEAAAAGTTMVVRYTLGRSLAAAKIEAAAATPDLDLGGSTVPDFGSPDGEQSSSAVESTPPAEAPNPSPATAGSTLPHRSAESLSFGGAGSSLSTGTATSAATGLDAMSPAGDGTTAAAPGPADASESVDTSLASAPVATGPIAPLSSWSFFPLMTLAGAAVAVTVLGRKILVRS